MLSFKSIVAGLAALALLLAFAAKPADAYYTGACIRMPARHEKGLMQYHMRVPHGTKYAHRYEEFPGETFYDALKKCRIKDFTTTYDIDGNAHVDFKYPLRYWSNSRENKCDVANQVALATRREWTPACVDGTPSTLAELWRTSWED